jgi:2-aminoadipate transaminase
VNPQIERLQRRSAQDRGIIALGGGLPSPEQFPRRLLARAFLRAVGDPHAPALQYGWPEGIDRLRAWVAGRLRARGVELATDDVIVTSGAQQAIAIAAQLAARRGQRIAVDAESYPAALDLFRTRGLRPTATTSAPAVYVMPAVSNPHGLGFSAARRRALLESGKLLVEDDAYAELRWDGAAGRPLVADARDRVFHIGTLSKMLCPGLRIGWLVAPPRLRTRALRQKRDRDLQAPTLSQVIVADFLAADDFDARLARLRAFYHRRADRLADRLRRHLPSFRFQFPDGGFSIYCETGEDLDDVGFLERALEHGVGFDPGQLFRADRASRPLSLRLCFSLVPEPELDEGVRRLERAWAQSAGGATLSAHAARSARVVGGGMPPRVRARQARPRRGTAAVDPLEPAVGVQAARRGNHRRLQGRARGVR